MVPYVFVAGSNKHDSAGTSNAPLGRGVDPGPSLMHIIMKGYKPDC